MGRILSIFNSMKNNNMSGTPVSEEPIDVKLTVLEYLNKAKEFLRYSLDDAIFNLEEAYDLSDESIKGTIKDVITLIKRKDTLLAQNSLEQLIMMFNLKKASEAMLGEDTIPHKVYDQNDPNIPVEYCERCKEPTGRAGKFDDSLYTSEGYGPFCQDCYDLLQKQFKEYKDSWIDESADHLWSKDEMDFPEEEYFNDFKKDIAGEKTGVEDVNDHELNIDQELEQKGIEESYKQSGFIKHNRFVTGNSIGSLKKKCPRCGATPGKKCLKQDGNIAIFPHSERIAKSKGYRTDYTESTDSTDYYIGDEFRDNLSKFVHAYVDREEKKRNAEEAQKRAESEIKWCQAAIVKLEALLDKKPSKIKEINNLKRQIREKELKLAFDPTYGAEVKELPVERQMVDKLEESLIKRYIRADDEPFENNVKYVAINLNNLGQGADIILHDGSVKHNTALDGYKVQDMLKKGYIKEIDKLEESNRVDTVTRKLAKRKLEGKCIGCGHSPCTCKTKGKLRNHPKGIGRAETREPSMTAIDNYVEHLRNKKKVGESVKRIQECDPTSGSDCNPVVRDKVSIDSSYNSETDEKSLTVTAKNQKADDLMDILKLSGLMPDKSATNPTPELSPVSTVVGEGYIYDLDTVSCDNCGAPREVGVNENADREKLCADCYKYTHDNPENFDVDESVIPEFEGSDEDWNNQVSKDSEFGDMIDDTFDENPPELHNSDEDKEGHWCDICGLYHSGSCEDEWENGSMDTTPDEEDDYPAWDNIEESMSLQEQEKKINESSSYYVEFVLRGVTQYLKVDNIKERYAVNKDEATNFSDLPEAKKEAGQLKEMPQYYTNVKVVPVNTLEETNMNESLTPDRRKEGLNGAPKTWSNEPNEQIAGWRALVQDADGPNNPKDMFNPVKGSDNILTVAANKKEEKLHEDSTVNTLAEKLQKKFSSSSLNEDYCISCEKRIPNGSDINQCEACYQKEKLEAKKKSKKVNESFMSVAKEAMDEAEAEMDRVFANPKSSIKERDAATEDYENAVDDYKEAKSQFKMEKVEESSNVAAKVAKAKEANPEEFCKIKKCLWRTKEDYCPKHKPVKNESIYNNGKFVIDPDATNSMSSKSDRFRPNARVYNATNGEVGKIIKIENGIVLVRTGLGVEKWEMNKTHTMVGEGTVKESLSKSQTNKLQGMLDNLEKKVKKLGAPPSAKTKITQSMERFEEKIAAMKATLDKKNGKEEDKKDEPKKDKEEQKKDSQKKNAPKNNNPFKAKEKTEPKEEGKETEPKSKEQKDTPKTEGGDSAAVGKVKDIGKGIYEADVKKPASKKKCADCGQCPPVKGGNGYCKKCAGMNEAIAAEDWSDIDDGDALTRQEQEEDAKRNSMSNWADDNKALPKPKSRGYQMGYRDAQKDYINGVRSYTDVFGEAKNKPVGTWKRDFHDGYMQGIKDAHAPFVK
jgi:hypothetical protein